MLGYVTLGTNDMARGAKFYDEVLATIGGTRGMEADTFIAWTNGNPQQCMLALIKPHNGEAATPGNGTMAAIAVDSREKVDVLHAKALELGAKDEGAVGERGPTFYAGYFRDLDGNKLNVFFMG